MAKNGASFRDMFCLSVLPLPCTFDKLPISFSLDGESVRGIPDTWKPTVQRRTVDTNITLYLYEGCHPSGLKITLECYCYRDFPVVEWCAYFTNTTATPSPLLSDIRITADFTANCVPILVHSDGDDQTYKSFNIIRTPLTEPLSLAPTKGVSCCGAFPYMRLCLSDCCINLAVGWTGGWTADFSPIQTSNGQSAIHAEVGQKRCHMRILQGEIMRTPRLTLMVSAKADENVSRNLWRRWYMKHILPRENGHEIPPKLCLHVWNEDGVEFTGATTKKQLLGLQTYISRGMKPDIWWFDAGWYPCNGDWTITGTWEHDEKRFPNGLGEIGKCCEDSGVQFLLWFEPERVRKDTWLWNNHPEWLIIRENDKNAMLNLGNPEACDWLITHVNQKIKDYHIHIYRQDFNFPALPYWEKAEEVSVLTEHDRIGAAENLHVQGYLRYWDALIDANPGLWIDSCASGGRRNDLDTMRRAVPLHYTDVGYGNHPVKQKQHRLMFEWIPYFRAHNMSWDNPDGSYATGSTPRPSDVFSFHCALTPSLTNMTTFYAPDSEYDVAKVMLPIWRKAAEIELRGDYYPLTECRESTKDWYAMQFDDIDSKDGFIQVIRNTQAKDGQFTVNMVVTHSDSVYRFENDETGENFTLTSKEIDNGISFSLPKRSGAVWFYHIVG